MLISVYLVAIGRMVFDNIHVCGAGAARDDNAVNTQIQLLNTNVILHSIEHASGADTAQLVSGYDQYVTLHGARCLYIRMATPKSHQEIREVLPRGREQYQT